MKIVNFIISQVPYQKTYIDAFLVLAFFFLFSISPLAQNTGFNAKYTDTLILKNKDRIIGEVKKMENGVILIETDYSDKDLDLKWIHVESINTSQFFLIILSDGKRYNSNLEKGAGPGKVIVKDEDEENQSND